ncbi:MAG TPA: SCO1664 family protein [Marmoricola sp.]|nr:SCO1664 family protein [Marmoricola sp.]
MSVAGPTELLHHGEIEVRGRIMPASNHTFLASLGAGGDAVAAVYKPVSGERPLWDFTDGSLAAREYAAWLVSECTGWRIVPPTTLRDGPAGRGMVQLWQEPDESQSPVDLVPEGRVPEGYLRVVDAFDRHDRPVTLIHEDSAGLRRMAVFDAVVNNTDRKGGHVLAMADGHRFGVDHGVCFHPEDKLRTVLWGWAGEPLEEPERGGVERVLHGLDEDLGVALADLLTPLEIRALRRRCQRLLALGTFPLPAGGWPAIPWPAF